MARKDTAKAPQETADTAETQYEAAVDASAVATGGPVLRDGHDQIIEEAPGISRAADMGTPMGDPGDPSTFGRSALLPDDLGDLDFDRGFDGPVDPGGDNGAGSSLLDDLDGIDSDGGGRLPDFADQIDSMDSDGGGGIPDFDDQTGWAMSQDWPDAPPGAEYLVNSMGAAADGDGETAVESLIHGIEEIRDSWTAAAESDDLASEMLEDLQEEEGPPDDDDDDDDGERQGGGGSGDAPGSQSMPAPDDGTGGEPDPSDFIGGDRGDIDPAPEAEPAGGAGALVGGRGDVDPAPEAEDAGGAGGLDMEMLGVGAVDPLDGESNLLGGEEGDLAEMSDAADLGGEVEGELDDALADADLGDAV